MGLFDGIKDWFDSKSEITDEQLRAQADFNKILEQMERDEQKRLQYEKEKYTESFVPDKPTFKYETYDRKDQELIEKEAKDAYKDYYANEQDSIKSVYEKEMNKADNTLEEAETDAKEEKDRISKELANELEDFRAEALKNNIMNSSIVSGVNKQKTDEAEKNIYNIDQELNNTREEVDHSKSTAKKRFDANNSKLDSEVNKKVYDLISNAEAKEDRNQSEVDKRNKQTKDAERAYNREVDNIRAERSREYDDNLKKMYNYEARHGYNGKRKEEYDERVKMAKEFYDRYPKDVAYEMVQRNHALPELLGYDYVKFLRELRDA